jgi:hypothetical protein
MKEKKMISSKKNHLVITLILACICIPARATEPNEAKTELKFESSSETVQWIDRRGKVAEGPIKPTHVAVLLIESERIPIIHWNDISNSRVGQTMSQEQHDFLNQGQVRYIRHKGAYREFHWYAVSKDDAKKMAQAIIEVLTNEADTRLKDLLDEQQELEEKISKVKKKFEEKLTGLQTTWDKLREKFKGGPHSLKDYNEPVLGLEAVNEAKETIKEMYKKLDALNVEIEGIKAKLLAIEEYKAKKNVGTNILAKLEQILCEQTIELAGASARKKAALEILMREEEFYNLNKKCEKTAYEADKLRDAVHGYEHMLRGAKEKLANPTPELLPPKVLQNKVTIYPVLVEE